MQIALANSLSFKNTLNNKQTSGLNKEILSSKKDWLQKQYDDKYIRDIKENNNVIVINGVGALASLLTSFVANEKHKSGLQFGVVAFSFGALVTYLFRPQKEKYDAQAQLDLNKETVNANSISK